MAAGNSAAAFTFVTPNDDPLALGLTKSGSPNSPTMASTSTFSPRSRKRSRARLTRPCNVRLVVTLSKVITDEVIEQELQGICIISR